MKIKTTIVQDELNNQIEVPEAVLEQEEQEVPKFSKEAPLILQKIAKNNETGGIDIVLSLSLDQTYVLLQFAIMFLTSQGLALFQGPEEAPKEDKPVVVELDKQLH